MIAAVTPNHLFVKAGATYREILTWLDDAGGPLSTAGYNARLQIRAWWGAPDPPLLTLTSDPAGGLTVGAGIDANQVVVHMTAAQTTVLPTGAPLRYDLLLTSTTDPSDVERLVQGAVVVDPGVTR